jgi:hypothetical protein
MIESSLPWLVNSVSCEWSATSSTMDKIVAHVKSSGFSIVKYFSDKLLLWGLSIPALPSLSEITMFDYFLNEGEATAFWQDSSVNGSSEALLKAELIPLSVPKSNLLLWVKLFPKENSTRFLVLIWSNSEHDLSPNTFSSSSLVSSGLLVSPLVLWWLLVPFLNSNIDYGSPFRPFLE